MTTHIEFREALKSIAAQEQALDKQRKELKTAGIQAVQEIVTNLKLKPSDIRWPWTDVLERLPEPQKKKAEPKYRGPNGELWCGRGHKPKWVKSILAQKGSIEEYLI